MAHLPRGVAILVSRSLSFVFSSSPLVLCILFLIFAPEKRTAYGRRSVEIYTRDRVAS